VANPLVALAIRYALDYDSYEELWPGSATPGTNMWVGIPGAFGEDRAFQRDVGRARQLLAEAGYPDGFEIEMVYPDLTLAGINFSTNAQKIQADLAEAGITIVLRPEDVSVALERYRSGEESFSYWAWYPNVLDPADFLSFLPGGTVATDRVHWEEDMVDSEVLELIAQAQVESNPDVRLAIFEQLQFYSQENSPFAPFMAPPIQTALRSDLDGYFWNPTLGLNIASLYRTE
jgi:peptide/nickel transport system substrate-binding protein